MNEQPGDITWVEFSAATAAAQAVVAAATGKSVVLCGLYLVCTTAVVVTIEDSSGTNLSGPMPFGANGGIVLPPHFAGWGKTASGKGLSILLGGAVQVSGAVGYRLVNG